MQATDEAAKAQQLLAEREKRAQDYQHLKQKYAHKSAAIKEVRHLPRDATSAMHKCLQQ
jgi:hypothetical protein